ncbi:hypothetical protein GH741_09175 [Aquibacillus halophilus]|uniref:Polymer-forming cytoskeletal protein n=1 Tax=Aquibacillus halophilus TaxID=930132 RepID=A0A6A8DEB8_9BACI|nr:polymer-forming cytoskeletal protein [Aquibacillus halophilus]MRH42856.1 hypothetical protein [Aquibacillus halophilus]
MKFKVLLTAGLSIGLLVACGSEETDTTTTNDPDVVTTASIVNEADAFVDAVSEDGTWIIATLGDITVEEDVVVAGQFHDKDDPEADIYRKIAPYTQDDDHNITESFTITVPKLTVQSENLRIQGGTLAGDVYVEANGFNLHESATIEGNIYYASADVEATAVIDGEVTGSVEVAGADVVTGATQVVVEDEQTLLDGIGEAGAWIIIFHEDMAVDQELVLEGEFTSKDEPARKLALYAQDEDRNITDSYTLTAPSLTIKSENARIQGGTFVGDVYVEANGFTLPDGTVEGNVYFANADYESSADLSGGTVTGTVEVQ